MCRCCQNCWEDFYWNCFEEKFCYDESIANYNPDDDEEYLASKKHSNGFGRLQANTNDNNNLTVPTPICNQPLRHNSSMIMNNAGKIHEEDYRRETQTNVPMLGPEILAVFANSQIFQDHQPKLNRISTKTYLTGVHTPHREVPTTPRESDQDRLIRRLEANLKVDTTDSSKSCEDISGTSGTPEKRITFTITSDSSPEGSQTLTPKKFDAIAEEEATDSERTPVNECIDDTNEVILRPRLIDRHPHLMPHAGLIAGASSTPRKLRRSATSVPHLSKVRSAASETDIFSITGSTGRISMTPEVPSISFSNLPKNYEDTPTIEKYRVSQSLYSIQTANAARVTQEDYSMPRYFRRSGMLMTQSSEMLSGGGGGGAGGSTSSNSVGSSRDELMRRPEKEKSKRMQLLRGNLPPLLIHSVSFRKTKEEGKQAD